MIRPGVGRLFRLALRRLLPARAEVEDEVRLHLELRAEQLMRSGMAPDAARAEAQRRFGNADARRSLEQSAAGRERRQRVREWLEGVWQDFRIALRALRREPRFAGFVALTMALGIGANAAMFGVVDRLLLRGPDHVLEPGRVVRFWFTGARPGQQKDTWGRVPYAAFEDLEQSARRFESVAAYTTHGALLGRGIDAKLQPGAWVSAKFFGLLGVRPALGRFFTEAESEIRIAHPLVVLGYGYWQRAYGGDSAALGKTLTIDQVPHQIIGVTPRGFTGVDLTGVDFWAPLNVPGSAMYSTKEVHWTRRWNTSWLSLVGRLKPGVTLEEAGADATRTHRERYDGPADWMRQAEMFVGPLGQHENGKEPAETPIIRWLIGVSLAVLLIACSNVGNLLLARAARRRGEIAVRLALGAGRARLTRLLLAEGLLLALGGALAGLAVAYGTGTLVRGLISPNVEWSSSPLGANVLLASLVIALGSGVLIGVIPALRSGRTDLVSDLKSGARDGAGNRSRLRALLTSAQAALSVILLVGAGLFVRSLIRVYRFDLGFAPDRILNVNVWWPDGREDSTEKVRRQAFYIQALAGVRALPGVEMASRAEGPPPLEGAISVRLRLPGRDSVPVAQMPYVTAVSRDYFATVGTALLRGRSFGDADGAGTQPVAIVSQAMADRFWPNQEPLGQCIMIGDDVHPCSTVVGVAADVRRFGITDPPSLSYYVPVGQEVNFGGSNLVVRTAGGPGVVRSIRALLHGLDPSVLYVGVDLLQDQLNPQLRPWRLGATMFVLCGVLALAVAAIGLYSVISYLVAHRRHELGVRMALGASDAAIVRLVVRDGMRMAIAGTVTGLGVAVLAGPWLEPLLFQTPARDPLVFGSVGVGLLAVAMAACIAPAIRARAIPPMTALKSE